MGTIGYKNEKITAGNALQAFQPQLMNTYRTYTPVYEEVLHLVGYRQILIANIPIALALYDITLSVNSGNLISGPWNFQSPDIDNYVIQEIDPSSTVVLIAGNTYAAAAKVNSGSPAWLCQPEYSGANTIERHATLVGSHDFPQVWGSDNKTGNFSPSFFFESHIKLSTKVNIKQFTIP